MIERKIRGGLLFCQQIKARKSGALTNIHNRVNYGFYACIAGQTLWRITNKGDYHGCQE